MTAPGLIVAAPASGSGKTVLTLALARALRRRGLRVRGAKAGPDYIDTAFHAAATGAAAANLDPWGMRADTLRAVAGGLAADADLVLCEGVMGLFDGAADGSGSTADVAALTGWPIVLAVNVQGQAASVAALVDGFVRHRADIAVRAVMFNRVGSARHEAMLRDAMVRALPEVAVLGAVPRDDALALPSRHLGLVQAGEHAGLEAFLDRAADIVAGRVDVDALLALARTGHDGGPAEEPLAPLGQRIAVARDPAFSFAYRETLEGWRRAGAEVVPFAPLAGDAPDADADAVFLPGGYPELHAGALAAQASFAAGLRAAAVRGARIYGECGGYMVLGQALTDANGVRHAMAGLLPLETSFVAPRRHLGYRRATLAVEAGFAGPGATFRGHEFRYAAVVAEGPGAALFDTFDATGAPLGPAGLALGQVCGSFVHLVDRAPEERA